jgi:hypothetical protein
MQIITLQVNVEVLLFIFDSTAQGIENSAKFGYRQTMFSCVKIAGK